MLLHQLVHAFHPLADLSFHPGILSHSLHHPHHLLHHLHHFMNHRPILLIELRIALPEQSLRRSLRMLFHEGVHAFHPLSDLLLIGAFGHLFHRTHHVLKCLHHLMHHLLVLLIQEFVTFSEQCLGGRSRSSAATATLFTRFIQDKRATSIRALSITRLIVTSIEKVGRLGSCG